MTGHKQRKEMSAFQESWACPRRQAGHRTALWGDAAGGDRSVPHITLQIQTPPAIPSYSSGWQKEAEAAIPKALSFCFVLGMHQETTSPSAGTSDPGERRFTPWVALMLLPWRSRLPTLQLEKRVRWWQWPHVPACLFPPLARISFTSPSEEKRPYHPSSSLQRVLHPTQHFGRLLCHLLHTLKLLSISHGTVHPASTTLTGVWSQMAL